jgi:hypothetical protein
MGVDRKGSAQQKIRRHLMIIGLALLSPILLWFVTWMAATATGATPPPFAYGFGYTDSGPPNFIATLWPGGPQMPDTFVRFFNLGIGFAVFLVAGIAGFTMIGSIGDLVGDNEG